MAATRSAPPTHAPDELIHGLGITPAVAAVLCCHSRDLAPDAYNKGIGQRGRLIHEEFGMRIYMGGVEDDGSRGVYVMMPRLAGIEAFRARAGLPSGPFSENYCVRWIGAIGPDGRFVEHTASIGDA